MKNAGEGKTVYEKAATLLNTLPRLVNLARFHMKTAFHEDVLDYEPIHLQITPAQIHPMIEAIQQPVSVQGDQAPEKSPRKLLDENNFRFILDQVPAIRTIEFSGSTDPFLNPHLLAMVNYAHRFNGAESTVYSDGLHLEPDIDHIVQSRLQTLAIRIHAHRPSIYALITGQPPQQFMQLLNNVKRLVSSKQAHQSYLEIDLVMTVDRHNVREIPDMIRFAEALGVNGLRLENYLSPDPAQASDRSLYSHYKPVVRFFQQLAETTLKQTPITVSLPTLVDANMSQHRHCLDPYTTVSVDAEFNVSGCSRQLLYQGPPAKIWDEDFWNNDMYQWLRTIHGANAHCQDQASPIPAVCQHCPKNMPR